MKKKKEKKEKVQKIELHIFIHQVPNMPAYTPITNPQSPITNPPLIVTYQSN